MKKMCLLAMVLVLLIMLINIQMAMAWQETEISKNVELPRNINIISPDPNLSPEIAAWSSRWEGIWDYGMPTVLIIEKIDLTSAKIVYCFGRGNNNRADYWRAEAKVKVKGNQIEFEKVRAGSVGKFTFKMSEDQKTLHGEYEQIRGSFLGKFKIIMEKVE